MPARVIDERWTTDFAPCSYFALQSLDPATRVPLGPPVRTEAPSSLLRTLRDTRWLCTTESRITSPRDTYHNTPATLALLSNYVPYSTPALTSITLVEAIGMRHPPTAEDVETLLASWAAAAASLPADADKQLPRLLAFLRDKWGTTRLAAWAYSPLNRPIPVPGLDGEPITMRAVAECVWEDPIGILAENAARIVLEGRFEGDQTIGSILKDLGVASKPSHDDHVKELRRLSTLEKSPRLFERAIEVLNSWGEALSDYDSSARASLLAPLATEAILPSHRETWVPARPAAYINDYAASAALFLSDPSPVNFIGSLRAEENTARTGSWVVLEALGVPRLSATLVTRPVTAGVGYPTDLARDLDYVIPKAQCYLAMKHARRHAELVDGRIHQALWALRVEVWDSLAAEYELSDAGTTVGPVKAKVLIAPQPLTPEVGDSARPQRTWKLLVASGSLHNRTLVLEEIVRLFFDGASDAGLVGFMLMVLGGDHVDRFDPPPIPEGTPVWRVDLDGYPENRPPIFAFLEDEDEDDDVEKVDESAAGGGDDSIIDRRR
ncbi:hypothetical protein BDK51DRAFT_50545 [Blyttiomyces helicus]|uniref:Uncharacterized protein n=1 Tax=Blyttiomyces helicus TaxID=388810 RepID=A0A4P9WEE7_9FUNG|nr:hypothetical protein BDK51DRAFT_50545 [Blyttiomyces helicus]|eukprot:RKO91091.1 hypothetical protein BDK51DRAFT_50545 [Blyttiomyces helicus]